MARGEGAGPDGRADPAVRAKGSCSCRLHLRDLLGRITPLLPHDTYGRLRAPQTAPVAGAGPPKSLAAVFEGGGRELLGGTLARAMPVPAGARRARRGAVPLTLPPTPMDHGSAGE
ncbi:hypothetical protein ACPCTO_14155 [Streptomyces olivoreticuli]|uniref:Uncharacterized protein n=1 Tax=Streptomyces blastmyceticus TaxID=68180 RepID=A0ABN0X606_9ACTN